MAAATTPPLDTLEPSPLAARRASARSVAAELEAIFGSAPAFEGPPESTRRFEPAAGLRPEAKGGARTAMLGALASAAFLGVAAGAFLVARSPEPAPSGARPPIPIEIARAAPIPAPGPLDPLGGVRAAAPPPVIAAASASPAKSPGGPAAVRRPRTPRACCTADVAEADRRLRQAYYSAIRAGVPRPILVSYHDRWEEIRRSRARQPRQLVAGYAALAHGLDHAAARPRHDGSRRVAQRSPRRPTYAPWWS